VLRYASMLCAVYAGPFWWTALWCERGVEEGEKHNHVFSQALALAVYGRESWAKSGSLGLLPLEPRRA